jgi:RNA polymerase sigma factor (sigma-70 family)
MPGPDRDARTSHADVDPRLIARAARGDAAAFGQIYARTAGGVRRYVATLIWNRWDAEDVTQDVFVKIFTGLHRYDPERAAFSAWTLRVARNAAIDHIRRVRARPACAEVDHRAPSDDTGRRCRESLRHVFAELDQHQREILMLRALGGFTPREVATHASATPGSINTSYHRARLAARERLQAIDAAPSTRTGGRCVGRGAVVSEAA